MAAARATALVMVGRGVLDGTIAFDDRFLFSFLAAISQTTFSARLLYIMCVISATMSIRITRNFRQCTIWRKSVRVHFTDVFVYTKAYT